MEETMEANAGSSRVSSKGFTSEREESSKSAEMKTETNCNLHSITLRPLQTQDAFISAMMEDVRDWLNQLLNLNIRGTELMSHLDTGVLLCQLANIIDKLISRSNCNNERTLCDKNLSGLATSPSRKGPADPLIDCKGCADLGGKGAVTFRENAQRGSFQSRDNITNFLKWCRSRLGMADTVLFETEDLILGRNERNVLLCLLEVARRGSKHGLLSVPQLVQMEKELCAQLGFESTAESTKDLISCQSENDDKKTGNDTAAENISSVDLDQSFCSIDDQMKDPEASGAETSSTSDAEMVPVDPPSPECQLSLCLRESLQSHYDQHFNDPHFDVGVNIMKETHMVHMRSLDELVRRFVENCTCPNPYPMVKISDGKYRIGERLMLIFVRLMRNHVMLRIGGGWETLADYLRRHDPCRAAEQHRQLEHSKTETEKQDDKLKAEKEEENPTV